MATRNNKKTKKSQSGSESLYISLDNTEEKRKNILLSIKQALFIQEEHERVLELRREKTEILKEIKTEMSDINVLYQKLKEFLPNVKQEVFETEKELGTTTKRKARTVDRKVKSALSSIREKEALSSRRVEEDNFDEEDSYKSEKDSKKLSRIDRIQNNLKVIESKLNNV